MSQVTIYSTRQCAQCLRAKQLLKAKGADFSELTVDDDPDLLQEMQLRTGQRSVPQIFIGDHHVGGFDDLRVLDRDGELDELLDLD
ncbi:MAG: glutaredoxin 3 [Gammaproteobacteria bacterium]|jgi:glutaredoxin 3